MHEADRLTVTYQRRLVVYACFLIVESQLGHLLVVTSVHV